MNTELKKRLDELCIFPFVMRTCLLPHLVKAKHISLSESFSNIFPCFIQWTGNAHITFIGEREKYYSHGALGRNITQCGSDLVIALPDTDLAARSYAIRELLDVRDGTFVIAGAAP